MKSLLVAVTFVTISGAAFAAPAPAAAPETLACMTSTNGVSRVADVRPDGRSDVLNEQMRCAQFLSTNIVKRAPKEVRA